MWLVTIGNVFLKLAHHMNFQSLSLCYLIYILNRQNEKQAATVVMRLTITTHEEHNIYIISHRVNGMGVRTGTMNEDQLAPAL